MAGAPGASVSASRCKRAHSDTSRRTRPLRLPDLRKRYWSAPAPGSPARVLGSADAGTLPSPKRPHLLDDTSGRPHRAVLTNDEGFYVLDDKVAASKLREVETREQRRSLKPGRLDIPRRVPPMSAHDLWDSNRPGSTLFLPVCDVSASLISLIAQFVDPALRKYASASGGMNIVDDRHGFRPAGTERWLKDGFLNAEQVLP